MKLLVVGDTIVDVDVFAKAVGLSLESPTLKANFTEKKVRLGGAANVVLHLSNLGADVYFVSALSAEYEVFLKDKAVSLINLDNSCENLKERIWISKGDSKYKYLQINKSSGVRNDIKYSSKLHAISQISFDKIIVSDYRLGLVTEELLSFVKKRSELKLAASQLSSHEPNFNLYNEFDILVCNEEEAKYVSDHPDVCVTLGASGSKYRDKYYPTKNVECLSAVGAGDAFLAAFSFYGNAHKANEYVADFLDQGVL